MTVKKKKLPGTKPPASSERKAMIIFFLILFMLILATILWHKRATLIQLVGKSKIYHRLHKPNRTGIPEGDYVHGFDISWYQGHVDWDKMFAIDHRGDTVRFEFAIIKATEGIRLKDHCFKRNWVEARRVGMIRGAYHFFHPGRSVDKQAENFFSRVDLLPGDLPPVIDVEKTNGLSRAAVANEVKQFSAILEDHYGVKPIIYSGRRFIQENLQRDFKDHHFWVAHYHNGDSLNRIAGIRNSFWQYTERGRLHGADKDVDFNVFHGKIEDLKALCIPEKQKRAGRSS